MDVRAISHGNGCTGFVVEIRDVCPFTGRELYCREELPDGTSADDARVRSLVVRDLMARGQFMSDEDMKWIESAEMVPGPYVYIIGSHEVQRIKIGYTNSPVKRLRALRNSSAAELDFLAILHGTMDDERTLHERFDDSRAHGEWFELTDHVRGWLSQVMDDPSARKTAIGFSYLADENMCNYRIVH